MQKYPRTLKISPLARKFQKLVTFEFWAFQLASTPHFTHFWVEIHKTSLLHVQGMQKYPRMQKISSLAQKLAILEFWAFQRGSTPHFTHF